MSLNHSPSVVTNGLVLYTDMSNTQKSWKGKPTTNITPDLGIVQVQSVSCTYIGVEDGWKKYALNGTWTAGTYPYAFAVDAFTCTGGVMYSTGIYVKTNVAPKFAALFTGMNYVNAAMDNAGTSFSITQSDGSIFVGRYGFQYTGTSGQNGYLVSQPVINQVFNSATDFLYIKSGQIEQNSFCSPFVAGTRSNTQAIVDLTGNNTLTANSLTYASDGTFSFNGSNDKITLNTNTLISGASNYTIDVAFKTSANSTDYIFGNYGTTAGATGGLEYYVWQSKLNNYIAGNTQSATTLNVGQWYIASVTRLGSTITHYLNGVADGSSTNGASISATNPFTIGNAHDYTSEAFGGTIGAIKVYNRALSAAEVSQNFQALRGRYGI